MNAATKYTDEIREFRPIEFKGLKFHPLKVKHYALYHNAKPAMELMLSTLPLRYVRLSWIHALEALDKEAEDKSIKTGYFGSILLLLDAALQTDAIHHPDAIMCARKEDGSLGALIIKQDGGEANALLDGDFPTVREILAAQNDYTIPDENWNPELVRAQAYLREQESRTGSGGSLEGAVFALAAATGRRAMEIWEWPIREFLQMQSAVDRRLRFQICTAAEMSGQVKFNHGNPYPTWIWDNKGILPHGFKSLKDLDKEAGGTLALPKN